jgi:hypothetical protein
LGCEHLIGVRSNPTITEKIMTKFIAVIAMLVTTSALAESPYCNPKSDGTDWIAKIGSSCPSGYFASGNCCEALHKGSPKAFPRIKGAPCSSGTFASGDSCKAFR